MIRTALVGMLVCASASLADNGRKDERLAPGPSAVVVPMRQTLVGWGVTGLKPREVGRIYWELIPTTEVLVRVVPIGPEGKPVRVNLIFHAFFPGRAERDPYSGLPRWPEGRPSRLAVMAQAFPLTFTIPELSLRLTLDGTAIDLTAPGSRYRNVPCLITTDDCAPDGVEADLDPSVLESMIAARTVQGQALGFPFELTKADQEALADFAARIGLTRK